MLSVATGFLFGLCAVILVLIMGTATPCLGRTGSILDGSGMALIRVSGSVDDVGFSWMLLESCSDWESVGFSWT